MKKSMKKKAVVKMSIDNSARREQRAERVSSGTWMGRNVVHRSKVDYNRQKEKLETKRMVMAG